MAIIGKQIIHLDSVDSTNNYMKDNLLSNSENEGLIVSCKNQTAGKGQNNNFWESESGKNITISFFIKPKDYIDISDQFKISVFVAVSVFEFINAHASNNISIKWPNDIYLYDCKVGGMITNITGKNLICGVGLNLLSSPQNFSKIDIEVDINNLLKLYFENIEKKKRSQIGRFSVIDIIIPPIR